MSLSLLLVFAALPMVDLSPYAVKPVGDGAWEYAYDLTGVKALGATPDALAAHGDDAVKAFLAQLPKTVRLRVEAAPLDLGAGRGLEQGRLATSFAQVGEGELDADNPLAMKRGSRLRPPLDPEEPKLLLPVGAVAWLVHQTEQRALLAVEADTEPLRRELWSAVLKHALAKHQGGGGDVKEGALVLAARVASATSCLDGAKVPASVRADAEASLAVDVQLARLTELPDNVVAPAPWSARPELRCAWVRDHALAQPFERNRAGSSAVLLFLELLERDAKVRGLYQRVRARRDAFLGAPQVEPLVVWQEKTGGDAAGSLLGLGDFLESLPVDQRVPPPLLAGAATPFARFFGELSATERESGFDELVSAVGDGRVRPDFSSWPQAREAWRAPLCAPAEAGGRVQPDGDWRERWQGTFVTLLGGSRETRSRGEPFARDEGERSELKVRLLVPPWLEVEPAPELFSGAATSLERLVTALKSAQLARLGAEAAALIPRLRSLAALADPSKAATREASDARQWVSRWRSDPRFKPDVREAFAAPFATGSERAHAGVVGVTRRELAVSFTSAPRTSFIGAGAGFTVQPSEQRYLVPAVVTVGTVAGATLRALEPARWRALVDAAGRDANEVQGPFSEALRR